MRIRTVKPDFFTHERLFDAEREANLPLRLAFIGLWCAADREGRFRWEPRRLGVQILPYDSVDFERVLHALVTRGFLVKYASGTGVFGCIPSFKKHQVVNFKEAASTLPEPPSKSGNLQDSHAKNDATGTREARVDDASPKEGKGREQEGKGREQEEQGAGAPSPWLLDHGVELPDPLRTTDCIAVAREWLAYKREKRQAYKPVGLRNAVAAWAKDFTADNFPEAVRRSMANNWQGIFPNDTNDRRPGGAGHGGLTPAERRNSTLDPIDVANVRANAAASAERDRKRLEEDPEYIPI